ncbi:uncharacterized protein LOC113359510 [Papaver somniferum]|uniref:uncharacterized protein LOC113359510 n=1 Tax=Papaver somniferum TaxID=3469 RepID=UPI000E7044AC|nr:uncharacterized protein LOC113359510 [Papaver somniferum]
MNFKSLSADEAATLEIPILEDEVLSDLKILGQNRALGPDGFQVGIILKCWYFMKTNIMKVVKDFENSGKIDWRLKSTFLALIPKKQVVEEIRDLRSISLTITIYKAISKILAERLKVMLPKLVSSQQSAFVKGRQILDSILVANECLDSRLKLGTPGLVCKIDLEKAFDNVKWFFLMEILQKMGFGNVWLLTMMFHKAEMDGLLGFFLSSSSNSVVKVSHLLFADDMLVILDDNVEQDIEGKTEIMGCSCDCFPTQYLGMPLGDKSNSTSKWDRIVEICKARLASWKRKTLSRDGKLSLIKSVLQSIPIYYFSLFMAPFKVIKSIEKKWWWRLGNEPEALWSRVVTDKHGISYLGWRTHQLKEKYGVSLWRNIFSTAEEIFKHCQFKIGKGDRIRLWEDKWSIQGSLSSLFPSLYSLSSSKNISIMDAFQNDVDGFKWNLGLNHRRRLYDTEIAELCIVIPLLDSIVLIPDMDDQFIWLGDKKGTFSVKTAYINYSQGIDPIIPFPSYKVWSRAWPRRVGFFLWKVCLNRLPTLSNLHHRNSALDSPNLCYLCGLTEETEDHLLLQCTSAISVWNYFMNFVGGGSPILHTVKEVIVGWKNPPLSAQGKQLWKRLPTAIPWGLWKARNDIAFSGKTFKLQGVIRDIKIDAFNIEAWIALRASIQRV